MKLIWKALFPVPLLSLLANHVISLDLFPHLQTALTVFILHTVRYEILRISCLHGSEICMQWVFQHASHICSFGISQAHFVPTNPTHQSVMPRCAKCLTDVCVHRFLRATAHCVITLKAGVGRNPTTFVWQDLATLADFYRLIFLPLLCVLISFYRH